MYARIRVVKFWERELSIGAYTVAVEDNLGLTYQSLNLGLFFIEIQVLIKSDG